jgi:hypothetical protein
MVIPNSELEEESQSITTIPMQCLITRCAVYSTSDGGFQLKPKHVAQNIIRHRKGFVVIAFLLPPSLSLICISQRDVTHKENSKCKIYYENISV